MKFDKKRLNHLIPVAIFFVIASIYFAPLYSGKTLVQSDNIQLTGVNKEVRDYKEKGEQIHWNNREFSGLPLQTPSNYNPFYNIYRFFFLGFMPRGVMMVLALFLGFYILIQVFGVSKWLSAIGSFAFAFSTFNIISIEVGHDYKVLAIAFMAPVLAGVISAYRGKCLKGGILTFFFAGLQLYFGHIQITYYLSMMVLAYLVIVIYKTAKEKTWKEFIKASLVLLIATVLAFGCNFGKLYSIIEYSGYSTRGGSELKQRDIERVRSEGLDKGYALQWSNGVMETFTLIFPYFYGGASSELLSKDSKTYKTMMSRGVDRQTSERIINSVPLYWGDQPYTGGAIYFGAICVFLFILGLLILEGPIKWWAVVLTLISLMLAMGKNLEWFTDIFFYHVPLYNKFRSVTMILSIAQLVVPFIAMLAFHKILTDFQSIKNPDKKVFQAGGIIVGLGIFFFLFKNSFFDFTSGRDSTYGLPGWLMDAIVFDRKRLFNSDIIRSIIFVILAVAGFWLYLKRAIKFSHIVVAIAALILIDLWVVDKRYLGVEDFQSLRRMSQQNFQPTIADNQILQDKSYYRVLNLAPQSQTPFSDGVTSYHHYSILGYNAIKMQRYQELIDRYIGKMDRSILNMLNTKYIIVKGQNEPLVQQNPDALGNAWLVKKVETVQNADEELEQIGKVDLGSEAVMDRRFDLELHKREFSGEGTVTFKGYHPERMTYDFSSSDDQFVVFSEIYYRPGWQAYIDGKPIPHVRVNYVLRGMEVPAGEHEIVFKYEPNSKVIGKYVIIGSFFIFLILLVIGGYLKKKGINLANA